MFTLGPTDRKLYSRYRGNDGRRPQAPAIEK